MTPILPRGASTRTASASPVSSCSSSRLTAMRSAWNVRVAGWMRRWRSSAGTAAATIAASREALVIGARARSRTMRDDDRARVAFLPEAKKDVGELGGSAALTRSAAVTGRSAPSLMSRFSSRSKEKPAAARLVVVTRDAQVHEDEVGPPAGRVAREKLAVPGVDQTGPSPRRGSASPARPPGWTASASRPMRESSGWRSQECLRVPALAERCVDQEPAVFRRHEERKNIVHHDRLVDDHSVILPPSFSAASLNLVSLASR